MKRLFVDTGGGMSLADESDPLHRDSMTVRDKWLEQGGLVVSSDYSNNSGLI